jgi:hypothetical protein
VDGIRNVTRRVVPITVTTVVAVVAVGLPPPTGVRVTVTFAGKMVPLGKFDPVTLTFVIPG